MMKLNQKPVPDSQIIEVYDKFEKAFLVAAKSGTAGDLDQLVTKGLPEHDLNYFLLSSRIDQDLWQKALSESIKAGNIRTFSHIIEKFPDLLNAQNISSGLKSGHPELFNCLIQDNRGKEFIENNPVEVANLALKFNQISCFWDIFENHKEVVLKNIEQIIAFACSYGRSKVVDCLFEDPQIKAKAHITVKDWSSPLEYAVKSGHADIVAKLKSIPEVEQSSLQETASVRRLVQLAIRSKDTDTFIALISDPKIRSILKDDRAKSGGIVNFCVLNGNDQIYLELIKYPEFHDLITHCADGDSSSRALANIFTYKRDAIIPATLAVISAQDKSEIACWHAPAAGYFQLAEQLFKDPEVIAFLENWKYRQICLLEKCIHFGDIETFNWAINRPEFAGFDYTTIDKSLFYLSSNKQDILVRLCQIPDLQQALSQNPKLTGEILREMIFANSSKVLTELLKIPGTIELLGIAMDENSAGGIENENIFDCLRIVYNTGQLKPIRSEIYGNILNYFIHEIGELDDSWATVKEYWDKISDNPNRKADKTAFMNCLFTSCEFGRSVCYCPQEIICHLMTEAVRSGDVSSYVSKMEQGKKTFPLVKDIVSDYCQTVYLPRMAQSLDDSAMNDPSFFSNKEFYETGSAFRELFAGFGGPEILKFTREWHRPDKGLANDMRPLKFGQTWKPLLEKFQLLTDTAGTWTIEALTKHEDLVSEGKTLNHCVKNGSYTSKCVKGYSHILSIRLNDTSKATLEVKLVDQANESTIKCPDGRLIQIAQAYTYGNSEILDGSDLGKVFNEFKRSLESGKIKLNKLTWGETEESKRAIRQLEATELEKITGYPMSRAKFFIQVCLGAFQQIRIKQKILVPEKSDLSFTGNGWKEKSIFTPLNV